MNRILLGLLLCTVIGMPAWSQDTAAEDPQGEDAETLEEQQPDVDEVDDSDLDEQVYTDTDDDFRPSEEISTDQSIAFPTDI